MYPNYNHRLRYLLVALLALVLILAAGLSGVAWGRFLDGVRGVL